MPYETASASDPNDLMDKLRVFALANGWTVDYWGVRTNPGGGAQSGSNNALAIHKGTDLYAVLYQDTSSNTTADPTPRLACYTYPGPWVANNGSDLQASKTSTTVANKLGGPYTAYHFFTDSTKTYLHCAVEVTPGRFSHFHIGTLEKAGGGTPVAYNTGLRWNFTTSPLYTSAADSSQHGRPFDDNITASNFVGTSIRVDSDGVTPRNQIMHSGDNSQGKGGYSTSSGSRLISHMARLMGASTITGRAPLMPLIVMSARTAGVYSIDGTPYDLRFISMDNLAPGELITVGSDQWRVFPVIRRNGASGVENSDLFGYAYRVVP